MNLKSGRALKLSLMACGFTILVGTASMQAVSAKSYDHVVSNSVMTTPSTSRNVNFTGIYPLYNKPADVKGARVVATAATLDRLANANVSTDNVRAYRVAETNSGSVYYKVVTFDGQYRGWIYGGKNKASFNGGVTAYTTFASQNLSAVQQGSTYKIANPGTANDGKTVTYQSPEWTQYKVGRAITDSTPYAKSVFKIDQTGTRTRENDQWVHITDVTNANSPANGWILMSGLTQVSTPVADNAIRVNLVDPDNNSSVIKSFDVTRSAAQKGTNFGYNTNGTWTISTNDQDTIQNQIRTALNGTNYGLEGLSAAQLAQVAQTQFGSSVNLVVKKADPIADNAVRINFVKPDDTIYKSVDWTKTGVVKGNNLGYQLSGNSAWGLSSADLAAIQDKINGVLGTGSTYELNAGNNTLTSGEIDTIAHGQFGGQIYLNVSAVKNQVGAIQPYAFKIDADLSTFTSLSGAAQAVLDLTSPSALTAVDGQYSTTAVTSAKGPDSGKTYSMSAAQAAQNPLLLETWFVANNIDATDQKAITSSLISAMKAQARKEFISTNVNFADFTGLPGTAFTSSSVMTYLNGHNANVLHSTKYPVAYSAPGVLAVTDQTTYVATSADAGTYGKAAKAYYAYADINLIP